MRYNGQEVDVVHISADTASELTSNVSQYDSSKNVLQVEYSISKNGDGKITYHAFLHVSKPKLVEG